MKLFCATMIHESNSFSPIPTSLDNFRESVLYLPSTNEGRHHLGQVLADVDHLRLGERFGVEVVVGLIANAEPSLPIQSAAYRMLREELLTNLERALPVDGVFLFLHGAQMAEDEPDCEGDLACRVRELVGPDVAIAVELDLHCNIGDRLLAAADIVLACLEYPHIDFASRAELAMELLIKTQACAIDPVTIIERVPVLGLYPTTCEPMISFIHSLQARQGRDGVYAVSLCQGFTGSDNPKTCAAIMVVAERGSQESARQMAKTIAEEFWQIREAGVQKRVSAPEAVRRALEWSRSPATGPLILADTCDNPGGGAAGDSTYFLSELLRLRVTDMALAMIWDPLAALAAARAGKGAHLQLRLGGKSSPASCAPLDVEAMVTAVKEDAWQMAQGARAPLGLTVAVEIQGNSVVINSVRQQTFSPECFTQVGVDPLKKKVLIVKSAQHFYETFAPWAANIVYADGPPGLPVSYTSYPYANIRRPVWPLDSLPFEAYGRTWS